MVGMQTPEFNSLMMEFTNKAFMGKFLIPLKQIKVFSEMQRPLSLPHVAQLVGMFNTKGMNHSLPLNAIKVLATGSEALDPDQAVPGNMVFEVWSGQHRVVAACEYLRGQMMEDLDSPGELAVDAELDHEKAYWYADVYKRGFYEANQELFQTLVVAQNIAAVGTLAPSFLDIWGVMRKVFQKKDLTPAERQMHYRNLVPGQWDNMDKALGQMKALLPSDGKLEDLTEAILNVPHPSWSKIQGNKDIVNRWQAVGFHKNDMKGLCKQVMCIPECQLILSLEALTGPEDQVLVGTVKHPHELLTPKFVLTASGGLYKTVQEWANHCFILVAILQGLDIAKATEGGGSGGSKNRRLELYRLDEKDDWLTVLDDSFNIALGRFPQPCDREGKKRQALTMLYHTPELSEGLGVMGLSKTGLITAGDLGKVLRIQAWWDLCRIFIPPMSLDTCYTFPLSNVEHPVEAPSLVAQRKGVLLAAAAAKERREGREKEAREKQEAEIAVAKLKGKELAKAKSSADKAFADAVEERKRAEAEQERLEEDIEMQDAALELLEKTPLALEPLPLSHPSSPAPPQPQEKTPCRPSESPTSTLHPVTTQRFESPGEPEHPPSDVDGMVDWMEKELGRHLDREASGVFGGILRKLIGVALNLALICSPQSKGALIDVCSGMNGDKVMGVVDLRSESKGKKRSAGEAEQSVDGKPGPYKRTRSGRIQSLAVADERREEESSEEDEDEDRGSPPWILGEGLDGDGGDIDGEGEDE
ncbi:hypothetical protein BS47DRAFT_1366301 [Hydnum rufescens UP504]|uniref:Uncharacterized protein n=1 Tax=Hydnum rufescens UP504 TaxID=1448309 RepID=A0A9P6AL93_9AGAM|nr:hypothetical protein BS47DRAFT_1366301 [Hydnum rufescens UP504]